MPEYLRYLACLPALLFTCVQAEIDPTLDWYTIESDLLVVHYADGNKRFAEKALAIAEQAHQRHTSDLGWTPLEKTHIVLSDETDHANGYATPVFFNRTVLFLAPPTEVNSLEDFDDWFDTLITHEYLHIVHLDKADGLPDDFRSGLGRFPLLFPNLLQPSWIIEGLATWKETDNIRGVGRGQGTSYQVMMRNEVINGLQPLDHVNLPVVTWPGGGTRYLYGTWFMQYLADRQGGRAIHDWVDAYSDNLVPFFINTNARDELGDTLSALWLDYDAWLREHFSLQIEQIESAGIKQGVPVTTHAYRSGSVFAHADDIYFIRANGYEEDTLVKLDANAELTELVELNSRGSLDVDTDRGVLLTQDEYCNRYHVYKDIYVYSEQDDALRRLTSCGRYLFAAWHPDGKSILAVQHDAGNMAIHRLDNDGARLESVWQGAAGEVLGNIDISANGKTLVAALWRPTHGWNIELLNLESGTWTAITRDVVIDHAPRYLPGGNIIFTREDGVAYNLYSYDPDTAPADSTRINRLSNVTGSALLASQAKQGGPLYYDGYGPEGYSVYRMDNMDVLAELDVSAPSYLNPVEYPLAQHTPRDYSPWPSMRPRWWFPVFGYSEQRAPLGFSTAASDALAFHNYQLSAAWDFKLEAPEAALQYRYVDRLFLGYQRLNEVRLDANDELAFSTKRDVVSAAVAFPLRKLHYQNNFLGSVIHDRESLNEVGSAAPVNNSFEDNLLGLAWLFNSSRIYPLSISRNDGMQLRLVAEDSDTLDSDYTGQVYTLDWKQYIRTGDESVLALRFLQGWGTDSPRAFRLGGEDVSVDFVGTLLGNTQAGVFNQRTYTLRGYKEGLAELRGRRAQLFTAEWRFPIQRNERGIMAPPIGLMQWSGNLFAETGAAYQDAPGKYYTGAGFELNFDTNLFYLVSLRLRLGYAHGFDQAIGDDRLYLSAGGIF